MIKKIVLPYLLDILSPQMRAPKEGTLSGWFAMKLMERANQETTRHVVERLQLQPSHTYVELGAGHGSGLRAAVVGGTAPPKRVVGVEISDAFRNKLEQVKEELDQTVSTSDHSCSIEIFGQDAKDMTSFLADGSVDRMLGVNVVYFLDPLEEYMQEIHRVLAPNGGTVVFGCKFGAIKDSPYPFVNKEEAPIVEKMEAAGFDVTSNKIDLGNDMYNYVELKGIKRT
mmetsp:Transcript_3474/g.7542  ORF Transcript_3474/g.7542 Transcript_3474/m.7542 type:complete len:227 (+) Transcript_3474:98-778(+)